MTLPSIAVNWLAIIIASVASFIFGWIWFGPLFGKAWLKGSGMSGKEAKKMHKDGMGGKMVWLFIGTIVMAYVLVMVMVWSGASGFGDIFMLALYLGIGFLAAGPLLGDVLWKGRPWSFYLIVAAYWILNFVVLGYVYSLF